MLCYCTLNRLQYSINITFTCTGKPTYLCDSLIMIFALLQWSGTEPTIFPRYACISLQNEKHVYKQEHTHMFMAALATIAKRWRQSECPSVDEWISRLYIHTMEYYPAIKEWSTNTCCSLDEPQKHYADWQMSDTGHILCNSVYKKYSE